MLGDSSGVALAEPVDDAGQGAALARRSLVLLVGTTERPPAEDELGRDAADLLLLGDEGAGRLVREQALRGEAAQDVVEIEQVPRELCEMFSSRRSEIETRRDQLVAEYRVEILVPAERLKAAVAALRESHPYEEVALDVYPLHAS